MSGLRKRTCLAAVFLVLVALCAAALWVRPQSREPAWYRESLAAFNRGNLQAATTELQHGLKTDPKNLRGYSLLADCYLVGGNVDQALAVLSRIQSLSPDYPHLASQTAEAYLSGDSLVLLRYAREAVIAEPRSPRAHLLLAYAIARIGGATDALFQARLADQIDGSTNLSEKLPAGSAVERDPARLASILRELIFRVPDE